MSEQLDAATAIYLPPTTPDELPALQVAGALVFVYVKDGELRVSVDLDTVEPSLIRADETVPVRVTMQGETIFEG